MGEMGQRLHRTKDRGGLRKYGNNTLTRTPPHQRIITLLDSKLVYEKSTNGHARGVLACQAHSFYQDSMARGNSLRVVNVRH